ncbi:MAG: gamma-mobile-trio protein GmtX [Paraburkholderia sp.]
MNSATIDHPNIVLDTLLAKGGRAHRIARLTALHEICRRHQESGSRDFSLPTIGRLTETEGILKGRVLYNMQSEDYRLLIPAWATYAGPATSQSMKPLASHEYLMRIHAPPIRSVMQTIIGERDKLREEVNLLKASTQVVVDGAQSVSVHREPPSCCRQRRAASTRSSLLQNEKRWRRRSRPTTSKDMAYAKAVMARS